MVSQITIKIAVGHKEDEDCPGGGSAYVTVEGCEYCITDAFIALFKDYDSPLRKCLLTALKRAKQLGIDLEQ